MTLAELKRYIKRKLGEPTINIELSDTQIDDRISDAKELFIEKHYDGSDEATLILDLVTDQKEYTLADSVLSVYKVYSKTEFLNDEPLLLKPLYLSSGSSGQLLQISDLTQIAFHRYALDLVNEIFDTTPKWDYNSTSKKFTIYHEVTTGEKLALGIFKNNSTDVEIYDSRWFKNYCTALCKLQWGYNVSKYENVNLPGGATINFNTIIQEAKEEIQKLEEELDSDYREPLGFYVG